MSDTYLMNQLKQMPLFWQPVGTTTMNNGIFSGYKSFNSIKLSWSKLSMSKYIFFKFIDLSYYLKSSSLQHRPLKFFLELQAMFHFTVSQRLLVASVMAASLEQLISLPNDTLYSVYISSCQIDTSSMELFCRIIKIFVCYHSHYYRLTWQL